MTPMAWFLLALFPASALLAAGYVWLIDPADELDDDSLWWRFAGTFAVAAWLLNGIAAQPAVQRALDPVVAAEHAVATHPVIAALAERQVQGRQAIQAAMVEQILAGATLEASLRSQFPALYQLVGSQTLGFAPDDVHLDWMRWHLATLQHWRAGQRHQLCAGLALLRPEGVAALAEDMPRELAAAFEQHLVASIVGADYSSAPKREAEGRQIPLNELQRRYAQLMRPLDDRYGEALMRQLSAPRFAASSPMAADATLVCRARIEQLHRVLDQDRPVAVAMARSTIMR
jgi:hypothetical protein